MVIEWDPRNPWAPGTHGPQELMGPRPRFPQLVRQTYHWQSPSITNHIHINWLWCKLDIGWNDNSKKGQTQGQQNNFRIVYDNYVEVRTEQIRNGPLEDVLFCHSVKPVSFLLGVVTVGRCRFLLLQIQLRLAFLFEMAAKSTSQGIYHRKQV